MFVPSRPASIRIRRRLALAGLSATLAVAPIAVTVGLGAAGPSAQAAAVVTATNSTPAYVDNAQEPRGVSIDAEAGARVTDVNVTVEFTKLSGTCPDLVDSDLAYFPNEIKYSLRSPSNTTVVILADVSYARVKTSKQVSATVTLDDEAASPVAATPRSDPATGTFRPSNPLSAFDGEMARGVWTLLVEDTRPGDPLCHHSFTLDVATEASVAPSIVVDGGPADGATVTEAPTYRFYSTGGGSKDCRVDGGPWEQCASPYTVPVDGLGDGPHTVEFRAIGSDGSLGQPTKRTFVLDAVPDDTTRPSVTIDSGPANGATVDTAPDYGFSSPDDDVAGFECAVDGEAFATCESPFTPGVTEPGEHTVAVRATDTTGNTGDPVTRSFVLRDAACDDATAALETAQADLDQARADVQVAKEKLRKARESGNPARIDRAKERLGTAREVRGQAKAAVAAAQTDVDDAC